MEKKILRFIYKKNQYSSVDTTELIKILICNYDMDKIISSIEHLEKIRKINTIDGAHKLLKQQPNIKLQAELTEAGRIEVRALNTERRANWALAISILAIISAIVPLLIKLMSPSVS